MATPRKQAGGKSPRSSSIKPGNIKPGNVKPGAIKADILKILRDNGARSFHPKEVAKLLGYSTYEAHKTFLTVVDEMKKQEEIKSVGARIQYGSSRRELAEGLLRLNREGFGYVEVEGYEDGFAVRPDDAGSAMNGDRVRIRFGDARTSGGRRKAVIVEILERAKMDLIGTLYQKGKLVYLEADDPTFPHKVNVTSAPADQPLHFKKALVGLDDFDAFRRQFNGHIVELFGAADDPDTLTRALMRRHGLTERFPVAPLEEADGISSDIPEAEIRRRTDLRARRIFTIDPETARDFDDAIHIEERADGGVDIGVHIADVSYYVSPGSALDREAYLRATSVYLADRAIPMLPERLSGDLCSLRPNEDRLAFSCLFTLDANDEVTDYAFHETVIHSGRRFTYEEAQAVIDGGLAGEPFAPDIQRAARLTERLRKKRHAQGSIDFDMPETRVRLDAAGNPVAIERKDRIASHFLIEELMLLANKMAAQELAKGRHKAEGGKGVYRVHDHPDAERLTNLATYVKAFGFMLPLKDGRVRPQDLNALMEAVRGKPAEPVIKYAALRSMAKAAYSTKNVGHYGLGFSHYAHFTSPIRRYPDLMAHRLLKGMAAGGPANEDLESRCEYCSERERKAEEAERDSIKQKQALYALKHLGDTFEGVVTNATRFGIFVEIPSLLLEGLIHVREMDDDYYEYDELRFALIGSHNGKSYHPGLAVRVRVEGANPNTGEIDFGFAQTQKTR
ncbi:MAG: ribonuclease R [Rhodothermales bacterium]|nr:ribonuclease R [Rhodothermales bacterium]